MAQASAEINPDRGPLRLQHPSDAADLRLYFKKRGSGQGVFFAGYGVLLDRAALYSFGGYTCKTCGGTGFVATNAKRWHFACERERYILEEIMGLEPGALDPPMADQVCGSCSGRGWKERKRRHNARRPLTVQLKGSSKKGKAAPSVTVAEDDLELFGRIENRLAMLVAWERAAIVDYYSGGGSIVVLYDRTPAGRTLLRRNSQELRPREFFENEIKRQEERAEKQRGALLEAANAQAVEVHRAAVASWVLTRRRADPEKAQRAALELLDGGAS